MDLILASTSPYRRALLQRLQIPFQCLPPGVEETALPGEQPEVLARRLAQAKAQAVAGDHPCALVIGSDQVASVNGLILGKPGSHDAAVAQLRASSGQEVTFYTGVAVICAEQGWAWHSVEPFSVYFRQLTDSAIENYLRREQPYDCAGSFKCEGLGISLFAGLRGNDPTSLEGLPLITLVDLLSRAGINVPAP